MELEETLKSMGYVKYVPAANTDKTQEVIQRVYFSNGEWKVEFYVKKKRD